MGRVLCLPLDCHFGDAALSNAKSNVTFLFTESACCETPNTYYNATPSQEAAPIAYLKYDCYDREVLAAWVWTLLHLRQKSLVHLPHILHPLPRNNYHRFYPWLLSLLWNVPIFAKKVSGATYSDGLDPWPVALIPPRKFLHERHVWLIPRLPATLAWSGPADCRLTT